MTLNEAAKTFKAYCLGVGCMTKCESCQFDKNWRTLNELPNELRLSMQSEMARINETACQITSGKFYIALNKE